MFTKLKEVTAAGGIGAGASFFWNKNIKQDLWGSVSGKIMTVTAAVVALKVAWDAVNKACGITLEAHIAKADEAHEAYSKLADEISTMENQVDSYAEQVDSIGNDYNIDLSGIDKLGDKIDALQSSDKLTLIDQAELDKIEAANNKLEAQIKLKQDLAEAEGRESARQALGAAYRTNYTNYGEFHNIAGASTGKDVGDFVTTEQYATTNILEASLGSIEQIREYKRELNELYGKDSQTEEEIKRIETLEAKIEQLTPKVADNINILTSLMDNFEDKDGNFFEFLKGTEYETFYDNALKVLNQYNNIDLFGTASDLSLMDSYFGDHKGIENMILSAMKSGKSASEIFEDMGYNLADVGVEADALDQYFIDLKEAAEEAATEIEEVGSSVANVSNLAKIQEGIDELSDSYEEFKDAGFVTAKALSGIPQELKSLEGYNLFESIVGNPKSTTQEIQNAFNQLVTEFIFSKNTVEDIINATDEELAVFYANLKKMGISNAEQAVAEFIQNSQLIDKAEAEYLNYCENKEGYTADFVNSATSMNGQLVSALGSAYKTDYNNWCRLLQAKSEAYNEFSSRVAAAQARAASKTYPSSFAQEQANAHMDDKAWRDLNAATLAAQEAKNKLTIDMGKVNTNYGGGFNYSGSPSSKSGGSSSENQPETFDWIERALKKVQRAIERLGKTADATYKTWGTRNTAINDQLKQVTSEIKTQEKAYDYYIKKAGNVGLSKKYRDLVKSGKIKIETIKDDKLKTKIQSYQEWYDKALECKDALQDLAATEAELYMQAFDNVSTKYDAILERYDWRQSMLDEHISQAEAQGQAVSAKYYQKMANNERDRLKQLNKKRDGLYQELEDAVNSGKIKKDSEDWNTMVNEINTVTLEIESVNTAILEFENNVRDLEWEAFDKLQDKISKINDEAEFLIELMSNDDMYDDDGKLTEEGMATMGLHGQNYNVYMEQAAQYAEEIKKLEEEISKDPNNQDLIERKQELIELQRESILSAESEKQAMVDLIEEGINKELEALQELIDKKKEALQSEKDLYEYQKKMKDLAKEQASVQKQLTAYQGDDSEENKARLQQLKVQLEESQDAIEEAEYEKYLSDQEELLDSMYEEYEEMLNARLDNIDDLIEETIHSINASAGDIKNTLEEQASEVGYTISDEMNSIWSGFDGERTVLTTYGEGMLSGFTTVNSTLEVMNNNLRSMIEQLNKIANTDIKGLDTENAYKSEEATPDKKSSSTSSNSSNKSNSSSNNKTSNSSNKTSGSDDGKITKGEKVTFNSGTYTAQSDGKGASGKQKLGEKVYVTNIKSGANRPYHISQDKDGKKPLGWVKKSQLKGYYTGAKNIDKDQWAITQEKGLEAIMHNGSILTPLAKGSSVFNASATENLYDFMNNPYEFVKANINLQQLSAIPKLHEFGNYEYSGDMSFELILPNVTNYEQFKYALKHDPDFEQSIRAMTTDRLFGKSALRKYK